MRWWGLLGILVIWAAVVSMRRRRERTANRGVPARGRPAHGAQAGPPHQAPDPDIDYEALEEAEREVRDLETDAKGRPLDEGVGDDWGPGTPKPPFV